MVEEPCRWPDRTADRHPGAVHAQSHVERPVRNVIIIGSGPAGYTAAVYAARACLQPLVFEGSVTAGGALMNTTEVENFPGFPDGIMGPALMDEMRAQAERFGAELVSDDVVAVDLTGDVKTVTHRRPTPTPARAVILAMGSGYRKLGLPDEEELSGHGVSWCATCDGFFFRDQDIAVVGGGDSAIEEATFLTRFGTKVTLIHRRDELRASKIMQERAFADPKIEFAWNSEVAEIHGDERLESLTLRDTADRSRARAPGHRPVHRDRPRPALGAGQGPGRPRRRGLRRSSQHPSTATNLPGVFACRRPGRPPLPAGDHRRRHRLRGRPGRRALPRRARPQRGDRAEAQAAVGSRGQSTPPRAPASEPLHRPGPCRARPACGTTVGTMVFTQ